MIITFLHLFKLLKILSSLNVVAGLWFIAVNMVTTSIASGEDVSLSSNQGQGTRLRRAVSSHPRQNCHTWSQWSNTHSPSSADPGDIEHVSKPDLDLFCPPAYGGNISDIMCRDERGEPFQGNQTDIHSGHTISCENPFIGAVCKLLDHPKVDKCPDLSMQYFCACSNKTFVVTTTMPTTKQNILTTRSPSTGTPTRHKSIVTGPPKYKFAGEGDLAMNVGGLLIPWWILLLVVTMIMFSINVCISVCLYKHLKQKLPNRKSREVHPLQQF